MEELHISTLTLSVIGSIMSILLAMIAFFLIRLLGQFDELQKNFKELIAKISLIDKDLSGDVGVIKTRLAEYDPVWERLRKAELDIASIKVGGCEQLRHCRTQ